MKTENQTREEVDRFTVNPSPETHFSWLRTRMSMERTLMSWVRTGTALIGFGFTIFQFIERLNTTAGVAVAARPNAPRYMALAMIGAGTIALVIAAGEYRWGVRYLWSEEFKPVAGVGDRWHTPILPVTILLIIVGLFAFFTVLLRIP